MIMIVIMIVIVTVTVIVIVSGIVIMIIIIKNRAAHTLNYTLVRQELWVPEPQTTVDDFCSWNPFCKAEKERRRKWARTSRRLSFVL